ncbi:MAG: hypothetical protein KME52_16630 [Desmonostoc geniculatum HA4340-LM1]|nr:hypothetical protein [Desmonostoc geniculatum HA4340-LM1]
MWWVQWLKVGVNNDTSRGTSPNYRDRSHAYRYLKSAMGTVPKTGGRFYIPIWDRGLARSF